MSHCTQNRLFWGCFSLPIFWLVLKSADVNCSDLIVVFSARCTIYISLLCYDVSVHLSVMFVHCGHGVQLIPDTFACLIDGLLLTDNASPGSSDGMMPGFLVEEGSGHLALCLPLLGPLVIVLVHTAAFRSYKLLNHSS